MDKKRGKIPKTKLIVHDNPKKEFRIKLWSVILTLIIILILSLYFYYPKNCGKDTTCFIEKAQSCSKAKVIEIKEGNEFTYEILSRKGNDCIFSVKMNKMKENTDYNLIKLLENKDMLCQIPLKEFKVQPLSNIKDILGKCSGPLKEALQELTIERLYSVVISNMGGINEELQNLIS